MAAQAQLGKLDFFERWFSNEKVLVKHSPNKGRYLVAKVPIKGGDNFFNCPPFACAVHESTKDFVCQNCFNDLKKEADDTHWDHWCEVCRQIWYCSEKCKQEDAKIHSGVECRAFQRINTDEYDPDIMTEIRALLRVFARIAPKESNTPDETVASLPSDYAENSNLSLAPPKSLKSNFSIKALEFWQLISNSYALVENGTLEGLMGVVNYTLSLLDPEALLSPEDTLEYYCKIRCNMFGVGGTENDRLVGYGVYVEASFFNHSCIPNVSLSRDNCSLVHQFYALKDLEAGTELNISYIDDLTKDTEGRRQHLLENYFFKCICARCILPQDSIPDFICQVRDCKGFLVPKKKGKKAKGRQCNVCFRWE